MDVLEDILSSHKEGPFEGENYSSEHPLLGDVSCWGLCVGIVGVCTDFIIDCIILCACAGFYPVGGSLILL